MGFRRKQVKKNRVRYGRRHQKGVGVIRATGAVQFNNARIIVAAVMAM